MCRRVSLILLAVIFSASIARGEKTYIVKKGDSLTKIAISYGNLTYWYKIYKANQNIIDDPALIYPGQELTIPKQVANNKANFSSLEGNPKLTERQNPTKAQKEPSKDKAKQLKQFRRAFKKVMRGKEHSDKSTKTSKETASDLGLGGMVLNETRSKVGNNFYSIFYKQWQAPKNAGNFTIKILERPMPSRGTIIEVKIDGQTAFKNRLEPRYHKTKQSALKAVYYCQKQLQRQMASNSEFQGY